MPTIFCYRSLFAIGLLAVAPALSAAPMKAGRGDCQLIVPAGWQDSNVIWDGACAAGTAHGQGVLRGYRQGGSTRLFFGEMKRGGLSLGVVEVDGGFIAGEFKGGVAVSNPERSILIKAFAAGSAAAKAMGQRLKLAKKAESSAFYLNKAQELEQQLD
jgi:hypothetical protein